MTRCSRSFRVTQVCLVFVWALAVMSAGAQQPPGLQEPADAGSVLDGSMDKPHGLRECYIVDPDGYVWVPSTALPATG